MRVQTHPRVQPEDTRSPAKTVKIGFLVENVQQEPDGSLTVQLSDLEPVGT